MNYWKTAPFAIVFAVLQAQSPTMTPLQAPAPTQAAPAATVPLYRVMVVQGSASAINYRNLKSSTKIEMKGTVLMAGAKGIAKVKSEDGAIHIAAKVEGMPAASTFGPEFLTYVLWGISPEGHPTNLGEIVLKKGKGKVAVVEPLQTFGLVVTAEPYFAVTQPSDVVVMENAVGKDAQGKVELIAAKYDLLKRGQYTVNMAATAPMEMDKKTPFEVYQARNAVAIARAAGAGTYSAEPLDKATEYLGKAEMESAGKKERIMMARESIQRAEEARNIAVTRQAAELVEQDQRQAQAKLDEARIQADAAAASLAASQGEVQRAESESMDLRSRLMGELNTILATRATARGLIVNMSGMLFQSGKATLLPEAREKLAKIAGILSAHKGLKIEADGFTDSTGKDEFNQRLSEKRAEVSRDFLVTQGVPADAIVFKGFGKKNPVSSNETTAGRQENRRVELVVSGEGVTGEPAPK